MAIATAIDKKTQNLNDAKEKLKINLNYLRDKHREPVKGIFRFHECPGGTHAFSFKEFKGDEVMNYTLTDGEISTVPLGVARHLNKNGWYPVHAYAKDEAGNNSMRIGQKVRRFSFQSLEFVDVEDLTPEGSPLITVEHI